MQIDEIEQLLAKNNSLINDFTYGYHRRTLLHKAAQTGDHRICKLLIDHDVDVNKQDARKRTPLWVAAEEGHGATCDVLIQNGAFVDKPDASEKTPLWIAASKKHENICKILINNGAEVSKKDKFGKSIWDALNDIDIATRCFHWHIEYSKMFNITKYYVQQ